MDIFLQRDIEDIEADNIEDFVTDVIDSIETSGIDEDYKETVLRHVYQMIPQYEDDEIEVFREDLLWYIFDEWERDDE